MTYPPQQPGPGGWGQQPPGTTPGQAPQQGAPQQQPAWYGNQHTGWPQGQPAPQAPAQAPPPPDWGSPGFGQPSWMAEPNGFGEVEPPKKKSKAPWIIGIVAVLAVAGGGAAALFFVFNGSPGEPKPVAQEVVDSVNKGDFASVRGQLCQSNRSELENYLKLLEGGEFDLRLGNVSKNGEKATAALSGTFSLDGTSQPVDQEMGLVVESGEWKVCDFDQ